MNLIKNILGFEKQKLFKAVNNDNLQNVKEIVSKNLTLVTKGDGKGETALHKAANIGSMDIISCLIDNGADINATDGEGQRPLHLAAHSGHKEVVELFLNMGIDVDSKTNTKLTPLHMATLEGKKDVVEILINNGANINAKTFYEKVMPIHMAAGNNEFDILQLFLDKGADINSKADDDMTPLHYATLAGNESMVSFLIYKGANVRASTQTECYTAKRLAENEGNEDMIILLSKHENT